MAVGGNRSAWPSRDDFTFASLLVIVLGGAFLFWQAWVNFHTEISSFVASLAHWQIVLIQHFKPVLHDVDGMVLHADPRSVTFPQIAAILNATGIYLRRPLCCSLAFWRSRAFWARSIAVSLETSTWTA